MYMGKPEVGGRRGRRLAVVLYFLFSFLASLSISHLSLSLAFLFPCAAHLYPPALRGGRLLGFEFFPPDLILNLLFLASFFFIFSSFIIRLQTLSSSSSPTSSSSSSYLSAKISWSDVETDEEMNKTNLVLAAHRGVPGKGRGCGVWERIGSLSSSIG